LITLGADEVVEVDGDVDDIPTDGEAAVDEIAIDDDSE